MNLTVFQKQFLEQSNASNLEYAAGEWRIDGISEKSGKLYLKIRNVFTHALLEAGEKRIAQVEVLGSPLESAHMLLRSYKSIRQYPTRSPSIKLANLAKKWEWITPREAEFIKSTHGMRNLSPRQKLRRTQINTQILARQRIYIPGPAEGIQRTHRLRRGTLDGIRNNPYTVASKAAVTFAVQSGLFTPRDVAFYNYARTVGTGNFTDRQLGYISGLNETLLRNARLIEAR